MRQNEKLPKPFNHLILLRTGRYAALSDVLFVHQQIKSLAPLTCAKHRHRETNKQLSRSARIYMAYLTGSSCQKEDGDDKAQTLLLST